MMMKKMAEALGLRLSQETEVTEFGKKTSHYLCWEIESSLRHESLPTHFILQGSPALALQVLSFLPDGVLEAPKSPIKFLKKREEPIIRDLFTALCLHEYLTVPVG